MNSWRHEPRDAREAEAARLLERASDLPSWSAAGKAAVWQQVRASAAPRPQIGLGLRLAFVSSLAFFVFAWVHTRMPLPGAATSTAVASDWTPVDLGAIGKLQVKASTVYQLPAAGSSSYRIALQSGELCAEIAHRDLPTQGPLVVEAPYAKVFVIGTRFCVAVHDEESTVSVTEGKVRVETATGAAFVSAGEMLRSNDVRLKPSPALQPASAPSVPTTPASAPAPHAAPAPAPTLAPTGPVAPIVAPLSAAAPVPSALAEQNALYARAIAARDQHDGPGALSGWRSYLDRFPQGVLAPEASQGILAELVAEGRNGEAMSAADAYLKSFPGDGRAAEVDFIRGNLLHEKFGKTADALAAYRDALTLATRPALRDDALFAVGACEQKLGHVAQARDTFARYRREFPNGAHAAEIARWMR